MTSPHLRPVGKETGVTSRPYAVPIVVGATLVAVALCLAFSWLTRTGALGFVVALVGVAVVASAGAVLREARRIGRGVRRLEATLRRDTAAVVRRLDLIDQAFTGMRGAEPTLRALTKASDTQETTLQTLVASQLEIARLVSSQLTTESLRTQLTFQLQQHQALLNLFTLLPVAEPLPTTSTRSIPADVVVLLLRELISTRPRLIVGCGSGTSSLWIALAIKRYRLASRLVVLEDDQNVIEAIRQHLRAHDVAEFAEVRAAPLTVADIDGCKTVWYDESALSDLTDVGLLFVHGPRDSAMPLIRFPAGPVFSSKLAPTSIIVLDELTTPGSHETVARWRLRLTDYNLEEVPVQDGAAVFRRVSSRVSD